MRTTNAPLCLPSPGEAAILKVRMAEDAWNSRDLDVQLSPIPRIAIGEIVLSS
jgi:nuclear transport factor 2 (NTF2) superfamily protein